MAVNAIVQLHRALRDDQTLKLNGQILVFSISHTNELVKIYGHYAILEGAEVALYRCRVKTLSLGPGGDAGSWKTTHNFVRALYSTFYPMHLKRIQDVLEQMNEPRLRSIPSSVDEIQPELSDSPAPSSGQNATEFKKPNAPASKKPRKQTAPQHKQNELLRAQIAQQKEQMEKQEERYRERMEKQEEQMEVLKQLLSRH